MVARCRNSLSAAEQIEVTILLVLAAVAVPLQPALSLSISQASLQAELEGAILQQTASVDYYLETAAPKWFADSYQDDGCATGLRSLFLSDLGSWQGALHGHVGHMAASRHDSRNAMLHPLGQFMHGACAHVSQEQKLHKEVVQSV